MWQGQGFHQGPELSVTCLCWWPGLLPAQGCELQCLLPGTGTSWKDGITWLLILVVTDPELLTQVVVARW